MLYRGFEKGFNKFSMVVDFKIGFENRLVVGFENLWGLCCKRELHEILADVEMPTNIQLELSRLPSSF